MRKSVIYTGHFVLKMVKSSGKFWSVNLCKMSTLQMQKKMKG